MNPFRPAPAPSQRLALIQLLCALFAVPGALILTALALALR